MEYPITQTTMPAKLKALNIDLPDGLTFLPDNIEEVTSKDAFVFGDNQQDIAKLLKKNNIVVEILGGKATAFRSRKTADWFGPAMLISYSIFSQNPELISVALNLISSYAYDFFKGSFGTKAIEVDIYVETEENTTIQKINYKGSAEGLKELPAVIKALKK